MGWDKEDQFQEDIVLERITFVVRDALEEAKKAMKPMKPMLRDMISRGEAVRIIQDLIDKLD